MRNPWVRPQTCWTLAALAASTVLAAPARADEGARLRLRWAAPAECPTGEAVRAEVDRLLGPAAARPPAPIAVSADVTRVEGGAFRVRLETPGEGTPRVREIHGASCAAIADAAALILALMIDPAAALAAPSAAGSRPDTVSPPGAVSSKPDTVSPPEAGIIAPGGAVIPPPGAVIAPPEVTTPPRRAASPPRDPSVSTPTSFRVAAWAGVDTASLSRVAATLALRGSFVHGAQRFEVGIVAIPTRAAALAARPTTGGDIDLVAGSVGTCRHFGAGALEVGPCVGAELGRLHAAGFGVTSPGEGSALWAALEGGGVLSYRLAAQVALVARVGAVVPLVRPRFVLDHVGPVFQPPAVAARGAAGVEVIF